MKRDPYEIRHLLPAVAPKPGSRLTKAHRCGRCSWQGWGNLDCPNYRPDDEPEAA